MGEKTMSKIPGNHLLNIPVSNAPTQKAPSAETRAKRGLLTKQKGKASLGSATPLKQKKVEKPAWTGKLQQMVDDFVALLAIPGAKLQAIVRAAQELFKATKGLDPTIEQAVVAKVADLPPDQKAVVANNVEEVGKNLLNLKVDNDTMDLIVAITNATTVPVPTTSFPTIGSLQLSQGAKPQIQY